MASTVVQLSLFSETPPAQLTAPGPNGGTPRRSCGSNGERGPELFQGEPDVPPGCPLGFNRCTVLPCHCELWPTVCF